MKLYAYIPILLFLTITIGLAIVLMWVAKIRARQNPYAAKLDPYECGFDAFDDLKENARSPFDVQFYLVSILFILFDVEIIFLLPYAVNLLEIGWFGFVSVTIFLLILGVGFCYEWRKGALEWHSV